MLSKFKAFSVMNEVVDESRDDGDNDDDDDGGNIDDGESGEAISGEAVESSNSGLESGEEAEVVEVVIMESVIGLEAVVDMEDGELPMM